MATRAEVEHDTTFVKQWTPQHNGRHKNAAEIEEDIDRTRRQMDVTMNEISEKFHPKHLFDEFIDLFRDGHNNERRDFLLGTSNRILDTIRKNPFPAMLIGTGIGWLLWKEENARNNWAEQLPPYVGRRDEPESTVESGPSVGEKIKDVSGTAKEKSKEYSEKAKETFTHGFQKVKESIGNVSQRGQEYSSNMKGNISHAKETAQHSFYKGKEQATDLFEKYPLAFGLGAVAIGVLVGASFPSTSSERKVAGEQSRRVKENLKERGQEAVEQGRNVAASITEDIKQQGTQEGITPESMKAQEGKLKTSVDIVVDRSADKIQGEIRQTGEQK